MGFLHVRAKILCCLEVDVSIILEIEVKKKEPRDYLENGYIQMATNSWTGVQQLQNHHSMLRFAPYGRILRELLHYFVKGPITSKRRKGVSDRGEFHIL